MKNPLDWFEWCRKHQIIAHTSGGRTYDPDAEFLKRLLRVDYRIDAQGKITKL